MTNLTLEDFECDGELDLIEAPDFLKGVELERFYKKYKITTKVESTEPCGDDGICRSFPGANFWYD